MRLMQYFADDVGTPMFKAIEEAEQGSELLLYAIVIFGLIMIALSIIMFLLSKKFAKTKNKNYIDLP